MKVLHFETFYRLVNSERFLHNVILKKVRFTLLRSHLLGVGVNTIFVRKSENFTNTKISFFFDVDVSSMLIHTKISLHASQHRATLGVM